jgi:hypothetical protein
MRVAGSALTVERGSIRATKENEVNISKAILGTLVGGSLLAGAIIGGVFGASALSVNAASTNTGANGHLAGPSASPGKFVPNEDPAHEATESAQREAQEDAGQVPTVP